MLCQLGVSNFHDKYVVCKKKNQQQQNSIQQYTEHAVLKILNIPKNIWLVHTVSLNGIKREISKIEFFYMA